MASGTITANGKYKLLGTATGTQAVTLPSDFEELYLLVMMASENRYVSFNIPRIALTNTNKEFRTTGTSIPGTTVGVYAKLSQVQISTVMYFTNVNTKTTEYLNTSTLAVYYR